MNANVTKENHRQYRRGVRAWKRYGNLLFPWRREVIPDFNNFMSSRFLSFVAGAYAAAGRKFQ